MKGRFVQSHNGLIRTSVLEEKTRSISHQEDSLVDMLRGQFCLISRTDHHYTILQQAAAILCNPPAMLFYLCHLVLCYHPSNPGSHSLIYVARELKLAAHSQTP
jgi:hypothetical protein